MKPKTGIVLKALVSFLNGAALFPTNQHVVQILLNDRKRDWPIEDPYEDWRLKYLHP